MAKMTVQSILLAERLRVSKILEGLEGQRRPRLAAELALRNQMDADSAIALLRAAPEESNSAEASFLRAMGGEAIGLSALGTEIKADNEATRKADRIAQLERTVKTLAPVRS